ncbi:hypothetical protein HYR69_11515 [Candidatus Sumerlaeota bacterium]|nr:hypothetical protein [Candidatus Sumerlaeota bacterium]
MIKKQRKVQQNLISKFMDKAYHGSAGTRDASVPDASRPQHLKRLMKVAEAKKKQMLDRILME